MKADHLEFLVEEPSMEAFLNVLLPRFLPEGTTFGIRPFQGKRDMLAKLPCRLKAYAKWLPQDWRIMVLIDCDSDSCLELKQQLEDFAVEAGLRTRSKSGASSWQLVNRIVIQELEAWFIADWPSLRAAYPALPAKAPKACCLPESISRTWETLEFTLKRRGYFAGGLRKIELARAVASFFDFENSSSESYAHFRDALVEATS